MLVQIITNVKRQKEARSLADTLIVPCLIVDDDSCLNKARYSAAVSSPSLSFGDDGCALLWYEGKQRLFLRLDFLEGANRHRRMYGGGKRQAIAKAIGVSAKYKPSVLDCTAGQGGDAFVLASLGCAVTMIERSLIAHALLADALDRALCGIAEMPEMHSDKSELNLIFARMHLIRGDSVSYMKKLTQAEPSGLAGQGCPDVVYLDPMFPEKKKSAAVKKEMTVFHRIIGADGDAGALLPDALSLARYRVIVKRPKAAPHLAEHAPTFQITGKSTRFDIYALASMPRSSLT